MPELVQIYLKLSEFIPQMERGLELPQRRKTPDQKLPDVFADDPALIDALAKYLSKFRGRVSHLKSKPRIRSIPPDQVYSFPGLEDEHKSRGLNGISTIFDQFSIGHYASMHERLNLSDLFAEERLRTLQSLLMYEIGYLVGCDLGWEETEDNVNANADAVYAEPDAALARRGRNTGRATMASMQQAAHANAPAVVKKRNGNAVSSGKGASAGDGASQTLLFIVGNRVQVKFDNKRWYPGAIARIDQLQGGKKKLHVKFDDGDEGKYVTRPGGYIDDFRSDPEREDAEITKWSVLYRFLVTSNIDADGRAHICPITSRNLDLTILLFNISRGSYRNEKLYQKIHLFLLNEARDRTNGSSEEDMWASSVLKHYDAQAEGAEKGSLTEADIGRSLTPIQDGSAASAEQLGIGEAKTPSASSGSSRKRPAGPLNLDASSDNAGRAAKAAKRRKAAPIATSTSASVGVVADAADPGVACEGDPGDSFDVTKLSNDVLAWPWEELQYDPLGKLGPHQFAAGLIAKMYEAPADAGFIARSEEMKLVTDNINAWVGGTFPDFKQIAENRNTMVLEHFEKQYLTRPMTTDEKSWLLKVTKTCLDALNQAGIHMDDRDVLVYKKLKDKSSLDNKAIDSEPYGTLSGHVTGFGKVNCATLHQISSDGPCVYLSIPVALVWSQEYDNIMSSLDPPFAVRAAEVYHCGQDILQNKDHYGRGYKKLLAEFVRGQSETSGLYVFLADQALPSSFVSALETESRLNRVELWAQYVEDDRLYGNEVVWTIIRAFLPFVDIFLLCCQLQDGPYTHHPSNNIVVSVLDEEYVGKSISILLLFIASGGYNEQGEFGQNNHYEPVCLISAATDEMGPGSAPGEQANDGVQGSGANDSVAADGAQPGGVRGPVQSSMGSFLVTTSNNVCSYCGEPGKYGCTALARCPGAACAGCLKLLPGASAIGFKCEIHRSETNATQTVAIRADWCMECGISRWPNSDTLLKCPSCSKFLCRYHSQTTPAADNVFRGPNARCRACFGTNEAGGFENLREKAATMILYSIFGEPNLSTLMTWSFDSMKKYLEKKKGGLEKDWRRTCSLADEISAFIFSLICCGLGALASRFMRILMLLNLAMDSLGLSMATLPIQFFYMISGDHTKLANSLSLAKAVHSFGRDIINSEIARKKGRPGRGAAKFLPFDAAKARQNGKLRIALAISDGLERAPTLDLMYGCLMFLLNILQAEVWLIVRSPITTKQRNNGVVPYDQTYLPAVEMIRALGEERVIFVCSDCADDYLVNIGQPLHWNVLVHVNGFNEGHFWRSLIMAQLAEIYLEMLSLASLLLNPMGRELGVPLWTITCHDLVSPTQLGWKEREPVLFLNSLYVTQQYYQKLVKEWGPPPADSGPPGLVYCGENIRMNETGGAEFLQAIVDMLHLVNVKWGFKPKFYMHGPASQSIAIRQYVRAYCAECNYRSDLVDQITSMPFFREKTEMLRWHHMRPEIMPIAGWPINPHTGCSDAALGCKPTLNWTPENSEWHAKVARHVNISMGFGDLLNTTTREQFTNTGAMILSGVIPYRAMIEHNHRAMDAESGIYCTDQIGQALWSTIPSLLSQARSAAPGARMPDVDTADFYTAPPCSQFCFAQIETVVDDSEAMKIKTILQIMICKGCFLHGSRVAAETALGVALRYMSLDPLTVRRGGARVTVQGIVNKPGDSIIASRIAWKNNWRATVKLDYTKEGDPVCTSATLHNSESVREAQSLIFLDSDRKLERAGRMKQMVRKLIPLLGWGRAAVGFVKTDNCKPHGLLIFLFCEAIPDGNDLHGSKIVQDVRDAWRERGEIGENARALARGLLHAGAWMNRELGWVQLDGSWGNLYTLPLSLSAPGLLIDPAVAGQLPEPAGIGFCDLGGCMYIGTLSERKDKRARPISKANPTQ